MVKINNITEIIEDIAPIELAEDWDNSGLQVESEDVNVKNILFAVDPTLRVARAAKRKGCNLIITHHPLLFSDIKSIRINEFPGELIEFLIKNKITLYSAHTNLDKAKEGFNEAFKEWLNLGNTKPVISDNKSKIVTYLPKENVYEVLKQLSIVGAGDIGNYRQASFISSGKGTFEALNKSNPAVGKKGFNKEKEKRIEIQFCSSKKKKIIDTLLKSHPYEEPVFDIIENVGKSESGLGVIGEMKKKTKLENILDRVKKDFKIDNVLYKGSLNQYVKKIAIISGSGSGYKVDVDLLITGDVKHHGFRNFKTALIDAGHFEMENFAMNKFYLKVKKIIKEKNNNVSVFFIKNELARKVY